MTRQIRVLSLYEGFFAGGARVLHTDLIHRLHTSAAQRHTVLSLTSEVRREGTVQRMQDDPRFLRLTRAGVDVLALGRTADDDQPGPVTFTDREIRIAANAMRRADVVLSLKEQPLGLLLALRHRGLMPDIPVAACLHRSDPTHSGAALAWLSDAAADGLLAATISCADSTSSAYSRYHAPATRQFVIPNGIDTRRFRPGRPDEIARTRHRLRIPPAAPVVIFAARFDAMKNPGLFLRTVAAHALRRPDTHYVLCGAGMIWTNPAFRALVDDSGIPTGANLHVLGIRDDMPALYQIADIVALTSAFGEASPLCLLEGAACGATPVTTNVGDSAQAVEGIGTVTSHREDEIATAWDDVIRRRPELRAAALQARPRLTRERMVGDYRAVLESLSGRQRIAA